MLVSIPFEPSIFNVEVNVHLVLEYLAFFVGFRYYVYLRKGGKDVITSGNRWSIILGAAVGAFVGSRLLGILEDPIFAFQQASVSELLNAKTIMGGLFGGLLGVELAKKLIGESASSGDLFTFPILLAIAIGRIGCFLTGINEFTYGTETAIFLGMDLGDGLHRHPLALYELCFLGILFALLWRIKKRPDLASGTIFKLFMIAYFAFRFFLEFLKPNTFFILGLSSIQWVCLACLGYYAPSIKKWIFHAGKKVHLL